MIKRLTKFYQDLTPKKQQYINATIVLTTICLVIGLIIYRMSAGQVVRQKKEEKFDNITKIETAVSKTDPQTTWRHHVGEEIEQLTKSVENLQRIAAADLEEKLKKQDKEDKEKEQLKEEIVLLKETLQEIRKNEGSNVHIAETNQGSGIVHAQAKLEINKISFQLDTSEQVNIKNINDTIPAGAFAKGVILGGVDASTSINSQSDPKPMLIRLVDPGTLPRRFKSDLKDCHVVASSYGDLSSERVYVRLEKLSCVEIASGEIIETEVGGYVAGEDSKVGIRGKVIEKGRNYLKSSVVGGVLQGVAGIIAPQTNTVVSPFGAFVGKQNAMQRFGQGAAEGVSGSMDRLSKYYISRAETITPVIEVAGGRMVDIVFTEGTQIGTELIRKKLEAKRVKSGQDQNNNQGFIDDLGDLGTNISNNIDRIHEKN